MLLPSTGMSVSIVRPSFLTVCPYRPDLLASLTSDLPLLFPLCWSFICCVHQRAGLLKYFTDLGLDVNATDKTGASALHIAAQSNHLAVVLQLLELGANQEMQDGNGKTALALSPKYNKQLVAALS